MTTTRTAAGPKGGPGAVGDGAGMQGAGAASQAPTDGATGSMAGERPEWRQKGRAEGSLVEPPEGWAGSPLIGDERSP